jgi:hypothetical protein
VDKSRLRLNKLMIPKSLTGYNVPWSLGENLCVTLLMVLERTDGVVRGRVGTSFGLLTRPARCAGHRQVIDSFSPINR